MSAQLDIVSQIKNYWNLKSTGALFLKLSNERLIQLFFVKGEIESVKYHGITGMEAIQEIPGLVAVKSQFYDGALSRIVNQLPSTSDIINMINDSALSGSKNGRASNNMVSSKEQVIISAVFTKYVGPIADLVFTEELNISRSVEQLIKGLSKQLDGLEEQLKFKEEVENALKNK